MLVNNVGDVLQTLIEFTKTQGALLGRDGDPLDNLLACRRMGIDPAIGAVLRVTGKVAKLEAIVRLGGLRTPEAKRLLRDIAVYAALTLVLREQESGVT